MLWATSTTVSVITLGVQDSHVENLAIYYPNQVGLSAATPTVFPASIVSPTSSNGGNGVKGVTLINSYAGIIGSFARGHIKECLIGAFKSGIILDSTQDFCLIDQVFHQVMWDIYAALSYPQAIDTWVNNNGIALTILRADGFMVSNWGIFGQGTGILLSDSAISGLSPKNSYGHFSNIEIDSTAYSVNAVSSNNSGGGHYLNNVTTDGTSTDMLLSSGGTESPLVFWNGGTARGATKYTVHSGVLRIQNVYEINFVPNTTTLTAPSIPASLTEIANPFPFKVRVIVSGGTVGNIYINNINVPVSSGIFELQVGDTIGMNYSSAPTWTWIPA